MSYLFEYEEIDDGYVSFGGDLKGGKISTCKLDFKDVYFVKELKFNIFSVSQMCNKKNSVLFTDTECVVLSPDFKLTDESHVLLKVPIKDNMYSVDLKNVVPQGGLTCLFAKATLDESNLWHRRLEHIKFKTINKLVRGNLVRGLPLKNFENDHTCVACQKGKQHKASCKTKTVSLISQPLQMLHIDLFGPTLIKSLMKKMYCLVVTDDFSRFSWVFFLATKDETSGILKDFITRIENLIDHKVKIIRYDNGTKFKNKEMNLFCGKKGIKREFSVARTPQKNRVAERKNKTLIEAARTMLADLKLPTTFWAEAVNTAYHLGKFDGKANKGFFVGYSVNSKAFRVFNSRTGIVEKTLHITFLKNKPNVAESGPTWLFDIDTLTKYMNYKPVVAENQSNGSTGEEEKKDAEDQGNKDNEILSTEEPRDNVVDKNIVYGCVADLNMPNFEEIVYSDDDDDDVGTKSDMTNLDTNILQVWTLVDLSYGKRAIGTKWICRNKKYERVARIEAIRLFLAYASFKDFIVYQMDVKSTFLNGKIEKEVYACQPLGFKDPEFPDRVYKTASTSMETSKPLMKDEIAEDDAPFDLEAYTDSDYAGVSLDRKSTTGGCQFLRSGLISWQCKKQTIVANSTTEAEDSYEKKLSQMIKIHTDHNVVDLLRKAFDVSSRLYTNDDWNEVKQLLRMELRLTLATTTATSLDEKQDRGNISKTQSKITPNEPSSLGTSLSGGPRGKDTMGDTIAQTRSENISKQFNNPPLLRVNTLRSVEDSLKLKEFMEIYTNLQQRVVDLENTNTVQAQEISSLKRRVKRLEKKRRSRTHGLKRLYKIGLSARVESSVKEQSLGEEDAFKQGKNIADISLSSSPAALNT
nr:putative ribonuclease H-like domain-containing protein [Tanacetum cinerariifolium]